MSMSAIELARMWETLENSPEKLMFGKMLTELSGQSEERVLSAARQVPLGGLRELVHQFNKVIADRRDERVQELAQDMFDDGISVDEMREYLAQRSL